MIRKAELATAKVFETPGELCNDDRMKGLVHQLPCMTLDPSKDYVHSAMVDENYVMLGSHIDMGMKVRIIKGEYVDFAKLIPKDRVLMTDEPQKMEIVSKDGQMFWIPASDNYKINSFGRWEQAFWIFSNIYCKAHPHQASELLQYNHLIHTAAMTYVWDNVYRYDIDFRLHLAVFPKRRGV